MQPETEDDEVFESSDTRFPSSTSSHHPSSSTAPTSTSTSTGGTMLCFPGKPHSNSAATVSSRPRQYEHHDSGCESTMRSSHSFSDSDTWSLGQFSPGRQPPHFFFAHYDDDEDDDDLVVLRARQRRVETRRAKTRGRRRASWPTVLLVDDDDEVENCAAHDNNTSAPLGRLDRRRRGQLLGPRYSECRRSIATQTTESLESLIDIALFTDDDDDNVFAPTPSPTPVLSGNHSGPLPDVIQPRPRLATYPLLHAALRSFNAADNSSHGADTAERNVGRELRRMADVFRPPPPPPPRQRRYTWSVQVSFTLPRLATGTTNPLTPYFLRQLLSFGRTVAHVTTKVLVCVVRFWALISYEIVNSG